MLAVWERSVWAPVGCKVVSEKGVETVFGEFVDGGGLIGLAGGATFFIVCWKRSTLPQVVG